MPACITSSRDNAIPVAKTWAKVNPRTGVWNLGKWSGIIGWVAVIWVMFIIILFVLPPVRDITVETFNYSPIAVAIVGLLVSRTGNSVHEKTGSDGVDRKAADRLDSGSIETIRQRGEARQLASTSAANYRFGTLTFVLWYAGGKKHFMTNEEAEHLTMSADQLLEEKLKTSNAETVIRFTKDRMTVSALSAPDYENASNASKLSHTRHHQRYRGTNDYSLGPY